MTGVDDGELRHLEAYLDSRIPGSRLELTTLPHAPELALYLINGDYPRDGLDPDQVQALMDNPPYWAFCWASGQALARHLIDRPARVQGRDVVDFGAGSGVVGLAAKLAGARRVTLCDSDHRALTACRLNAARNGLAAAYAYSLEEVLAMDNSDSTVMVADVFYDRDNLPLLQTLCASFGEVLVADSRLKGQPLPGMEVFGQHRSHTVPDLDESAEFNQVTFYKSI